MTSSTATHSQPPYLLLGPARQQLAQRNVDGERFADRQPVGVTVHLHVGVAVSESVDTDRERIEFDTPVVRNAVPRVDGGFGDPVFRLDGEGDTLSAPSVSS